MCRGAAFTWITNDNTRCGHRILTLRLHDCSCIQQAGSHSSHGVSGAGPAMVLRLTVMRKASAWTCRLLILVNGSTDMAWLWAAERTSNSNDGDLHCSEVALGLQGHGAAVPPPRGPPEVVALDEASGSIPRCFCLVCVGCRLGLLCLCAGHPPVQQPMSLNCERRAGIVPFPSTCSTRQGWISNAGTLR